MVKISFLAGMLFYTAIWLIVRVTVRIIRKKIDWKRELHLLLMYVNLAVIIRFTFYPLFLVDGQIQPLVFDPNAIFPVKMNLIPFHNPFDYETVKITILNIGGNILMFVPTGIILPILYKRLDRFPKVLLAGVMISVCIEVIQLLFKDRYTEINDVILNAVGVAIGYGIYALVQHLRKKRLTQKGDVLSDIK